MSYPCHLFFIFIFIFIITDHVISLKLVLYVLKVLDDNVDEETNNFQMAKVQLHGILSLCFFCQFQPGFA